MTKLLAPKPEYYAVIPNITISISISRSRCFWTKAVAYFFPLIETKIYYNLEMAKPYDHVFKIVVTGDYGCGKTSLIYKFIKLDVPENAMNVDQRIHTIELDSKRIRLQLWDLIFCPRYNLSSKACYKGAKGIILVYDVTNRESFEGVRSWKQELEELEIDALLMLIGNKCDLENQRQVSVVEAQQLAAELGILFMETSALEAVNVEQSFLSLVQNIKETEEARKAALSVKDKNRSCNLS